MMNEGAVDNYLNEEEKAYFKSGGETEVKYEDTQENEPTLEEIINDDAENNNGQARDDHQADTASEHQSSDEDEQIEETSVEETVDRKRDFEKAFKAELHKRKELEQQLKASKDLEKQVELLKQQQIAAQQKPEEIPDPETDPLGYHNYKIAKLEHNQQQQNDYLRQRYEDELRTRQQTEFVNNYRNSAQEFAKISPDFKDAYNYLIKSRTDENLAAGYSQEQASALIVEEEMAIVAKAYQDGINPAERIYKLSTVRGYSAAKPKDGKDLSQIAKGIKNSKSLKSGGGLPDERVPGIDDIDSMSFTEFDKLWSNLKEKSKGR